MGQIVGEGGISDGLVWRLLLDREDGSAAVRSIQVCLFQSGVLTNKDFARSASGVCFLALSFGGPCLEGLIKTRSKKHTLPSMTDTTLGWEKNVKSNRPLET